MSELVTIQHQPTPLADQMQYAEALASASLVPDSFKRNPPNILMALAIADDLGESPWTVMSEMAVISGKPSFSAKFMRARVRKAGHKLREELLPNGTARCVIIRADDPEFEHVAEWDRAKAEQHGYWGKGHWQKNPSLMLKNRALSECVREACYEVMGGIGYTPDEVEDFAPQKPAPVVTQVPTSPPTPPEPSHASRAQLQEIADAMRATETDKAAMLTLARELTGRDIASANDLTADEADIITAALHSQPEVVQAELVEESA